MLSIAKKLSCTFFSIAIFDFTLVKLLFTFFNQILETVVSKCLIEANESRYTSIAFPALGAGARGYPRGVVSNTMNRAINTFLKTTPTIYINSIILVIFNDKEMIKVQSY